AGLGAFLLLGQGAQWRSVEPGDPQGLAAGLRALARRAKPAGPDAEVLWLPCLTATADEGLREQAGRAARAFADGHARQRAQRQAELAADAKALELELLGHALGLARAAGELSGALEELSRLEELRRKLARERRPAPEQAPLDAALAARRGEAEARLLAALDGLAELAADRLARQQALAKVRAEQRVLGGRPARVLLHPAEPLPRRTEPREVVLLTSTPDGDPTRDGLALVLVQPVDEPPARPGARPGGKPRPPKRSRLKLEEEGVERASPELRPADGRAPPPADAAAAARASDEQACGMGNAPACYRFGLAAAEGSGGARDAVSARAALDRACDGGFALACHQLGLFMESGALGPADPDRARGYFGRACNDKLQKACDKIGR
ncbi:MAG TPA: hypothetical protein P5076_22705, partial [Myxococcota bacterium]|nr:hypothetical protein [Myxococcota bacterium]